MDLSTNDFPKTLDGDIEDIDVYIPCYKGIKIKHYGHIDNKRPVWYIVYIPSIGRSRNIRRAMDEAEIEYIDYFENDIEGEFKFQAKDMKVVAELLKAKTAGSSISPFSYKNLPKSDYYIENLEEYKEIINRVPKGDLLIIHRITKRFMNNILQKKYRRIDIESDMKKKCMSRQTKEYIHSMGEWNTYLKYLKKEIDIYYKEKQDDR